MVVIFESANGFSDELCGAYLIFFFGGGGGGVVELGNSLS